MNFSFLDEQNPQADADPSKRTYRCGICDLAFRRKEHLQRHAASHSGTRQFICPLCQETFTRQDSLQRHEKKCPSKTEDNDSGNSKKRIRQRKKAPRQCVRCVQMGEKCDYESPCSQCIRSGSRCIVATRSIKRLAKSNKEDDESVQRVDDASTSDGVVAQRVVTMLADLCHPSDLDLLRQQRQQQQQQQQQHSPEQLLPTPTIPTISRIISPPIPMTDETTVNLFPEFLVNDAIFHDAPSQWPFLFDYNVPSLSSQSTPINFHSDSMMQGKVLESESDTGEDDTWYVPGPNKVPTDVKTGSHPWKSAFPVTVNESLLALSQLDPLEARCVQIREACTKGKYANVGLYTKTFAHHTPIVHLPTFDITTVSDILLYAMVSVGGAYTIDGLKRKRLRLSQRMHQTLLCESAKKVKGDDFESKKIELEAIQAMCIMHLLATFEQSAREREESRRAGIDAIISRARVAGLFEENESHHDNFPLSPTEWKFWALQESRRRTAYFIFLLSCGLVVWFNSSPKINHAEIKLPFPCPDNLWEARDAASANLCYLRTRNAIRFSQAISQLLQSEAIVTQIPQTGFSKLLTILALHSHFHTHAQYVEAFSANLDTNDRLLAFESTRRAVNRWRRDWSSSEDGSDLRQSPFYRVALEYWWLLRLFIRGDRRRILDQPYDSEITFRSIKTITIAMRAFISGNESITAFASDTDVSSIVPLLSAEMDDWKLVSK